MPRKQPAESPLYVKLPTDAVDRLHRAAALLKIHKKDLVANLVTKYVNSDGSPTVGTYNFQPYDPLPAPAPTPEILNPEQAAVFLQLDVPTVVALAEAGELPGRKLGSAWRFSRDALVAHLSAIS